MSPDLFEKDNSGWRRKETVRAERQMRQDARAERVENRMMRERKPLRCGLKQKKLIVVGCRGNSPLRKRSCGPSRKIK